jgi:hypothetical protein
MFGPIGIPLDFQKPPRDPQLGTQWRKHGETLPWTLVEYDFDEVHLRGPGGCKGILRVSTEDFHKDYGRA